jgi:hypothetical protein
MEQVRRDFLESAVEAGRWLGREWPSFVHFGALAVLAGAQGWLAWEFWGDFTSDPAKQATLRAVGLGLVGLEVVGLQIASRAAARGEEAKARTWRGAWAAFALLNLSVDVSALSKLLEEGAETQRHARAQYLEREATIEDLGARIERADDPFGAAWLGSVDAYDVAIAAKQREIAARPHAGERWHGARARELGDLQTARAVAVQITEWEAERQRMRDEAGRAEPPPEVGAEFRPLELVIDKIPGVDVTPEQVRNALAIGLAAGMKLALTLAAWVGMAAKHIQPASQTPVPQPSNDREPQPRPAPTRREPPKRRVQFKPISRT